MTEAQAVQLVRGMKPGLEIDPAMRVTSAEKAIVLANRKADSSYGGDDRVAWIVTLSSQWGQVRVDVDDHNGSILGVDKTK